MDSRQKRYQFIADIPRERFVEILKEATGVGPAMKILGVTHRGFYTLIRERMERENLTKEIFKKPVRNHPRAQTSYRFEEIFTVPTAVKRGHPLKRCLYLLQLARPYCVRCWRRDEEDGVKLQVDHINGEYNDNRLENLQLLCPSCHSLTDTYRRRNKAKKPRGIRCNIYRGPMTETSGNIHDNPAVKNRLVFIENWKDECSICGVKPEDSMIELDHINGNNRDNRLKNLRLLCLNCHSTTETYCRSRNIKPKKFCHDCGKKCKGYRCKICHSNSLKTSVKERRKRGICTVCGKPTAASVSKQCESCYSTRFARILTESYHEFLTVELFGLLPFSD